MLNSEKRRLILLNVEMFRWCGKNPDKQKNDWDRWKRNGGDLDYVEHDCFICFIVKQETGHRSCSDGKYCFIDWGASKKSCEEEGSIYTKFFDSTGVIRSHYANIIAETLQQAADALPEDEVEGTPTPWKVSSSGRAIVSEVKGEEYVLIAKCPEPSGNPRGYDLWKKNAPDIILAKNNFEKMVQYLKRCARVAEDRPRDVPGVLLDAGRILKELKEERLSIAYK